MKQFRASVRAAARKRWRTALLAAILVLTLAASGGFFYYRSLNSRIPRDEGYYFPPHAIAEPTEVTNAEVNLHHGQVDAPRLELSLAQWANNDQALMNDRSVLNILLCGIDTETGDTRGGRADAIILVSINKKKRDIIVTSFLRDSCTYIDLTRDTDNPRTQVGRIASAYSLGGPATLMKTLSANYKIPIDDYICVDFDSFPKLIDTLGGVTLDINLADADYINSTAPSVKGKFPSGEQVKLTGQQALIYSRINFDSDDARATRQRQLLMAIIERARESSPGQILKALSKILRQVSTDLTEDEVNALTKDAFSQGWLNYDVIQYYSPALPDAKDATCLSAYVNNQRVLIVNYAQEAQRMQDNIYGSTSIKNAKGTGGDYIAS